MSEIEVHPLSPERQADFLAYFEGPAFADNPRWGFCYCQFLHVDHAVVRWSERSAEHNRAQACERIAGGRMQGYLAYRDGAVVGWCNAGPRLNFDALNDSPERDAERIGQIGCFVVAREHRRSGVATALLAAALQGLRAQGLSVAEAMPAQADDDVSAPGNDARQHYGPRRLFERAGFVPHRLDDDGSKLFMRRSLLDR